MPANSPQLTSPIDSRLARQLIASAPEEAQQLSDELRGQSWSETDIGWLQNELAKRFGYLFVDWSRPSQRQVEYAAIDLHRQICVERKWPLVVVFIGLHYCTIQIIWTRRCARPSSAWADSPSKSKRLLTR